MPPIAPNIPPMPTTDPTARGGNMSETPANRFADQPWCAAVASPIKATTTHRFEIRETNRIGSTEQAQMSIAVLRARFTDHPRLMSDDDNQPPATLPASAIK